MTAGLAIMTVLFIGAALATGQALARNWRAPWQLVPYALLLAAGERFMLYALYQAALLSVVWYVTTAALLAAVAAAAYRFTMARRMTAQYPWLYERAGPFGWRERGPPR
jgi:hypothetical protein